MEKACKVFGIFGITIFMIVTLVLLVAIINTMVNNNASAQSSTSCKIYYDKAKELAEKGAEDLPQGITMDFDPRVSKATSSIAYNQIYRNCKKYGE